MTCPIPHDILNFGNYCVLKLSLQWKHYHCVWLLLIQLFRCNIQHWKDNFLRSQGHFHILPLLQHAWGISQILRRRQGAQSLKNSGASKMSVKETRKNLLTCLLPRLSQGEPVDCCCQSFCNFYRQNTVIAHSQVGTTTTSILLIAIELWWKQYFCNRSTVGNTWE